MEPLLKRRWVVQVRNSEGQVVNTKRFVRKGAARSYKVWMDKTAVGGHKWQTPPPPGAPPVWTVTIEKDAS